MDSTPQKPKSYLQFKTWLAIGATYFGTLALIAYPLGFATFWIQVWREYTYDAATALYAASLMPGSVVVAKAFAVLASALLTIVGTSGLVAVGVSWYRVGTWASQVIPEELLESRTVLLFLVSKRGRVLYLLVVLLLAAVTPYTGWWLSLKNGADIFYYSCAVLIAGGGVAVGSNLLFRDMEEMQDKRTVYGQAIPLMAASALVASLFLVPLMPSDLPSVQFSEGTVEEAILISHSEGYWYVVDPPESGVLALPDSAVGTVTISGASRSNP